MLKRLSKKVEETFSTVRRGHNDSSSSSSEYSRQNPTLGSNPTLLSEEDNLESGQASLKRNRSRSHSLPRKLVKQMRNAFKPDAHADARQSPGPEGASVVFLGAVALSSKESLTDTSTPKSARRKQSSMSTSQKEGTSVFYTPESSLAAQKICQALKGDNREEMRSSLHEALSILQDYTFASEFVKEGGHEQIIRLMIAARRNPHQKDIEILLLQAFSQLSEYALTDDSPNDRQLFSWHLVNNDFLHSVVNYVKDLSVDLIGLRSALEIIVVFMQNCFARSHFIIESIDPQILYDQLRSSRLRHHEDAILVSEIHRGIVALLNSIFDYTAQRRQDELINAVMTYLSEDKLRILVECIPALQDAGNKGDSNEYLNEQLVRLQHYLLCPLEVNMNTAADSKESRLVTDMRDLCGLIAGENGPAATRKGEQQAYEQLGFQNPSNPSADFEEVPPGVLAFKCIMHFAYDHSTKAEEMVNSSSVAPEHRFPLVAAGKALTKTLCDLLGVGDDWDQSPSCLYPMLFSVPKPFEETFCSAIVAYNRTWQEMRAVRDDLVNVDKVVREQIIQALRHRPASFAKFEEFMCQLSSDDVKTQWRIQQNSQAEIALQSPAFRELCERLRPQAVELIKKRRLAIMEKGENFIARDKTNRNRDKQTYNLTLSSNQKTIHCSQVVDNKISSIKPEIWQVANISNIVLGGESMKLKTTKKSNTGWSFSLEIEHDTSKDLWEFVAKDENTVHNWIDGITILRGGQMTSRLFNGELEQLLNLEMKIRRLDLDNVKVPSSPPDVPQMPDNYDFYMES